MDNKKIIGILVKIQSELKVKKNQFNDFGGYKYRSAEDILEALKPILKKHDCVVLITDEIKQVGERYYIEATASLENDQGSVSSKGIAREQLSLKGMTEAQITGACSSYARKYALNGLFAIDDAVDDDSNNIGDPEQPKSFDIKELEKLITKTSSSKLKLCNAYGINKLDDIYDPNLFNEIKRVLELKLSKLEQQIK